MWFAGSLMGCCLVCLLPALHCCCSKSTSVAVVCRTCNVLALYRRGAHYFQRHYFQKKSTKYERVFVRYYYVPGYTLASVHACMQRIGDCKDQTHDDESKTRDW